MCSAFTHLLGGRWDGAELACRLASQGTNSGAGRACFARWLVRTQRIRGPTRPTAKVRNCGAMGHSWSIDLFLLASRVLSGDCCTQICCPASLAQSEAIPRLGLHFCKGQGWELGGVGAQCSQALITQFSLLAPRNTGSDIGPEFKSHLCDLTVSMSSGK